MQLLLLKLVRNRRNHQKKKILKMMVLMVPEEQVVPVEPVLLEVSYSVEPVDQEHLAKVMMRNTKYAMLQNMMLKTNTGCSEKITVPDYWPLTIVFTVLPSSV